MLDTIIIKACGNIQFSLPNNINLMTPYILIEQGDWFEDEIKFVRKMLTRGMKAIDIGANFGVYTLSMAAAVGSTGKIWAFEPAKSTAAHLADSIDLNKFEQVVLENKALSNTEGQAFLAISPHPEFNALAEANDHNCETIEVTTLDQMQKKHQWKEIDFIKIDAEDQEINVISGGKEFFSQHSPLVLFEIRAGDSLHLELVEAFSAIGYASYRLLPGLDVLIPFNPEDSIDDFLLNLFSCKSDCAAQLAKRGLLILNSQLAINIQPYLCESRYAWKNTCSNKPYHKSILPNLEKYFQAPDDFLEKGLICHAISHDESLPPQIRAEALGQAFAIFQRQSDPQKNPLRLLSFARVCAEYGMQGVATVALGHFFAFLMQNGEIEINEPFLPPLSRFDCIPPKENIEEWLIAAAMEGIELYSSYSSFFTEKKFLERLQAINNLGFASDEMKRRLELVISRFKLA